MNIDNKRRNYSIISGIINSVLCIQKTLNTRIIELYNKLFLPASLYGSENWTVGARDARRIIAAEKKFMVKTEGYTWTDYKTKTEISKELNRIPGLDKTQEYSSNWTRRVSRMPRNRLPRITESYKPKGRKNQGRPMEICETGAGQQVGQLLDENDDNNDDEHC